MEQNIDQLAQEMTDFCTQKLVVEHSLPVELKVAFLRKPHQFLKEQWNTLTMRYPSAITTLVMVSLLVGEVEGGWCGSRWLRAY